MGKVREPRSSLLPCSPSHGGCGYVTDPRLRRLAGFADSPPRFCRTSWWLPAAIAATAAGALSDHQLAAVAIASVVCVAARAMCEWVRIQTLRERADVWIFAMRAPRRTMRPCACR